MTGVRACAACGASSAPQMYQQHQDAAGIFNASSRGEPVLICVRCVATDPRATALRNMVFLDDDGSE
jgi:hypothetical protein